MKTTTALLAAAGIGRVAAAAVAAPAPTAPAAAARVARSVGSIHVSLPFSSPH